MPKCVKIFRILPDIYVKKSCGGVDTFKLGIWELGENVDRFKQFLEDQAFFSGSLLMVVLIKVKSIKLMEVPKTLSTIGSGRGFRTIFKL